MKLQRSVLLALLSIHELGVSMASRTGRLDLHGERLKAVTPTCVCAVFTILLCARFLCFQQTNVGAWCGCTLTIGFRALQCLNYAWPTQQRECGPFEALGSRGLQFIELRTGIGMMVTQNREMAASVLLVGARKLYCTKLLA